MDIIQWKMLNSITILIIRDNPNLMNVNDSKLLSKWDTTLVNGTKTVKLIFDDPNSVYKIALYLMQHNKDSYLAYHRADKTNLFDKYLPEFEQMIKTMKWID